MTDSLEAVLRGSVADVLEKMFFVRSLGEETGNAAAREEEVLVHVGFEGDPSGSLSLSVPGATARSISADFLGVEEEELCRRQIGEVVCELANMICGSVLSRVESSATFRLATPYLVSSSDDGENFGVQAHHTAAHSVLISGERLAVVLQIGPGPREPEARLPAKGGGPLCPDERRAS